MLRLFLWRATHPMKASMTAKPYCAKRILFPWWLIPFMLAFLPCTVLVGLFFGGVAGAQTAHKKTSARSSEKNNLQQELVRTETGFFEAWKTRDQSYFREHMPESGVFWGESGTFSREQQLAQLQASAKSCTMEGYGLSEFGVLPLISGTYLLTYKAEQYATCNGEKAPVHMNGSSIYIFKTGRWQAVYRAEVPLKNQSSSD
jgi:hypothetical protein